MNPTVLRYIKSPCGNTTEFDEGSGIGYRCMTCGAILGSIGMPSYCKLEQEKQDLIEVLSDTH